MSSGGAGAAKAGPGVHFSQPRSPGGPLGRSRGRGGWGDPAMTRCAPAERPRQLCPGAGSPGAPAGPRRELGERRGFACLVLCVRTRTPAHACCLTSLSHSYPSFELRGPRGPGGSQGGGGKAWGCGDGVEVAGLARRSPALLAHPTPARGGPAEDLLLRPHASVAAATLPSGAQGRAAGGLDQPHAKCKNVAGRVRGGGARFLLSQLTPEERHAAHPRFQCWNLRSSWTKGEVF